MSGEGVQPPAAPGKGPAESLAKPCQSSGSTQQLLAAGGLPMPSAAHCAAIADQLAAGLVCPTQQVQTCHSLQLPLWATECSVQTRCRHRVACRTFCSCLLQPCEVPLQGRQSNSYSPRDGNINSPGAALYDTWHAPAVAAQDLNTPVDAELVWADGETCAG